ncbi:PulJ/GspJ family protein [Salinibacterium hongtaonis]|uniref:PulJ/GspJ family protein n=1 Tax=Homoserinimonas hongtaonis TaxID=2079791 RepID=UPI00131F3241|nr:type II secretion system protein [Salinibacterium hongtaonis]
MARRAHEGLRSEQSGFTLIEMVVAVGIFAIFMSLFLSAVIGLTRGTTQAKLNAETSSEVLIVFRAMDRQVRYADAINFPGVGSSGAKYVEFRTPSSSSVSGLTMCTQWRFTPAKGTMESRQWQDIAGATPSPWSVKTASMIDTAGANYPFKMAPATTTGSARQQLVLTLNAGNPDANAVSEVSTTYVARNSSILSESNADANGDGQSDHLICNRTGLRP